VKHIFPEAPAAPEPDALTIDVPSGATRSVTISGPRFAALTPSQRERFVDGYAEDVARLADKPRTVSQTGPALGGAA
jgi:hypothetical protein